VRLEIFLTIPIVHIDDGEYLSLSFFFPSSDRWSTFALGLAIAPWNVLAGGKFRTDAEEEKRRQTGEQGRKVMGPWERTEQERKVSQALENIATELGAKHITSGTSKLRPLIFFLKENWCHLVY
jgi:hypothetical protein